MSSELYLVPKPLIQIRFIPKTPGVSFIPSILCQTLSMHGVGHDGSLELRITPAPKGTTLVAGSIALYFGPSKAP